MRWTTRARRIAVVACLLIPAAVIVATSRTQAQQKFQPPPIAQPPKFQPPPIQPMQPPKMPNFQPPPVMQMEWRCNGCNAFLGTGAAPVAKCPGCGATIINGQGGPNPAPPINRPPPVNVNPPAANPPDLGQVNLPPGKGAGRSSSYGVILAIVIGGFVFLLVVAAGVGVGIYFAVAQGSGKKSKRSSSRKRARRRAEDD